MVAVVVLVGCGERRSSLRDEWEAFPPTPGPGTSPSPAPPRRLLGTAALGPDEFLDPAVPRRLSEER